MPRLLAIAALLVALGAGARLRWMTPVDASDLRVCPDALEYEEAAANLAHGEGYYLVVAGKKYPPRYPPGFSMLLVPVLLLSDDIPGSGIPGVLVAALLGILVMWRLGARAGGRSGAGIGALLLALSPLHVHWSRMVMSDVPTTTAIAGVGLWTLVLLDRDASAVQWGLVGVCAGLAATIRLTNFALVPATALGILVGPVRIRRMLAYAAGLLLGCAPLLAYDAVRFGSPLKTGYGVWAPLRYFGPGFVLGGHFGGVPGSNLVNYARALAGLGSLYPWPVAALAVLGAAEALRCPGTPRSLARFALVLVATVFALQVGFFWQDERFLLPALPFVLVLAVVPYGRGASRMSLAVAAVLLLLAGVSLYRDAPGAYAPDKYFAEVPTLREIDAAVEPNAAVIVRTNAWYFERLLRQHGRDRVWIPPTADDHEAIIRSQGIGPFGATADDGAWMREPLGLPFDPVRAAAVVHAVLGEGRPLYVSNLLAFQVPFLDQLTRTLAARFWLEPLHGGRWSLVRVRERTPAR